jgi:deoxyadenosine/deoxycytidine kinase
MGADEWALCERLYTELCHSPAARPPTAMLYLRGPLEEIHARILRRGRVAECETPLAYWEALHQRYARWIRQFRACPVVEVDIREHDFHADPEAIERVLARLRPLGIRADGPAVERRVLRERGRARAAGCARRPAVVSESGTACAV